MSEVDDWKTVSSAMATEDPVFVVGVARSGTTALRNTIERLEAFRPTGGDSPETRVFLRPFALLDLLDSNDRRFHRFLLGDDDEAAALLERLRVLDADIGPLRRALAQMIGDGGRFARARWRLLGWHHAVRLFFHHARRARGTRRIFEKTPAHLRHLPEVHLTFPRMRAVCMFRHPVDVYSSYRKRLAASEKKGIDEAKIGWLRISPRKFWKRYADLYANYELAREQRPESVMLLTYEQLTGAPEESLRAVCEFIGEPFDRANLLEAPEERRDAHGSPKPSSRLVANRKDWREWLSEEEASKIEAHLPNEMRRLGFEARC